MRSPDGRIGHRAGLCGAPGERPARPAPRLAGRTSALRSTTQLALIAALEAALAQQEEGEEPERNAQVEEEEEFGADRSVRGLGPGPGRARAGTPRSWQSRLRHQ